MPYLVDTNILLRSVDPKHPMYADATKAVAILRRQGEQPCIVAQNLIEFWNVYTRPLDKNGLGYSPEQAAAEVNRLKDLFQLLPDTPAIYQQWEQLVTRYEVKGVQVHDARLVAAMLVHRLTEVLTFNVADFTRYTEIKALSPPEIVTTQR